MYLISSYYRLLICCFCFMLGGLPIAQCQYHHSISGKIVDAQGHPVAEASVSLTDAEGQITETLSDINGSYRFDNLNRFGHYELDVIKNPSPIIQVNYWDVYVLRQQLIMGMDLMAYALLVADMDQSFALNLFDVLAIMKMLERQAGANQGEWNFYNIYQTSLEITNQLYFSEILVIDRLSSNLENLDFVLLQDGDINHDTDPRL